MFPAVPELSARGVIQQVFPLHEQRILGQLMKSWVQAVCEKQPLGQQKQLTHAWEVTRLERKGDPVWSDLQMTSAITLG